MDFQSGPGFAEKMDREDPLREFRHEFHIPSPEGKQVIYFCGHSLGLQPKKAKERINAELEDWATLGVEGHFKGREPWVDYHKQFKAPLARLTGAKEHEVVTMNSLSVNLHLMLASFYRPDKKRYKIIMEGDAFSSDMYAVESQCLLHNIDPEKAIIEVFPCNGNDIICTEDILEKIHKHRHELALVFLGGVNYFTGQVVEMEKITKEAHAAGALAGFDLAHAIGNIPLSLHSWKVDFAVWCSYKYLNSGPGATGGAYIHEKHSLNENMPRFAGWWGHNEKERFLMKKGFLPEPGASGWQLSNANVFSLAIQKSSLDLFDQAGIENLREKSIKLTAYLEFLIRNLEGLNNKYTLSILTPEQPEERGSQLSLKVKGGAKELLEILRSRGAITDYRSPDVLRIAPVPLYNSFKEVYQLAECLKEYCSYEA